MKFRPFSSEWFKKVCNKIEPLANIHKGTVSLFTVMFISQWFNFVTDFFEQEVDWFKKSVTKWNHQLIYITIQYP
jgi:hypothetical protein